MKHDWLEFRRLPVGLYEYLKAVLGPGGHDGSTSISEAAESKFLHSMPAGLPTRTRRPAPRLEPQGAWGDKKSGGGVVQRGSQVRRQGEDNREAVRKHRLLAVREPSVWQVWALRRRALHCEGPWQEVEPQVCAGD